MNPRNANRLNAFLLVLVGSIGFFVWLTITSQYSDPSKDTDFSQDYKAGAGVLKPTSVYGPFDNLVAPLFVPNVCVENVISWPIIAKACSLAVSGGIVGTLVWLTLKFESSGSPFKWGLFYTYATASIILSPISWEHNFLIAFPGFVLFFPRFTRREQKVFVLIILFLGVPLVNLVGPVIQYYAPGKVGMLGFLFTRLHTVGLLLILFLFSKKSGRIGLKHGTILRYSLEGLPLISGKNYVHSLPSSRVTGTRR